jgi:hypothetical protein
MFQPHDIVRHHLYGLGKVLSTGYRCALVRFRSGIEMICCAENLKLEPF